MIEQLISLIAPHDCISCNREGSLLCEWCKAEALIPLPPRCYRCHTLTVDSATCKKCYTRSGLKNVWIGGEYESAAKLLMHKLKFERARSAAIIVAEILDEMLPYFSNEVIISHIPTASSRRRQRGYDQSELIARCLAKKRRMRHVALLGRIGQSRQVGADKQTRHSQLHKAFCVQKAEYLMIKPTVLLIDDIVTSGATIEAASRALKQAGASKVYAAAFAQKL